MWYRYLLLGYFSDMNLTLIEQIELMIRKPYADDESLLRQLRDWMESRLLEQGSVQESSTLDDLLHGVLGQMHAPSTAPMIRTGLQNFDEEMGGFLPSEFVVIAGRPAMGKTALAVQLSRHIAREHPVLFFSFDLSKELLTWRLLCNVSEVGFDSILQHRLSEEEKIRIAAAGTELEGLRLRIMESGIHHLSALTDSILKSIDNHGTKVIVIDDLQHITFRKLVSNRAQEMGYICRSLKNIAREKGVCIIALSQLSRSVESRNGEKRPSSSDLRDSGAIEEEADKVIGVYRPEYYGFEFDCEGNSTKNLMELMVLKNRLGRLGNITIRHADNFSHFTTFSGHESALEFNPSRMDELVDGDTSPF